MRDELRALDLAGALAEHEHALGGKAVQLGAAIRAGLPVPEGVVLPAPLVDAVAADRRSVIADLRGLLAGLVDHDHGVAVRSSAIGEDSAAASFAGQHLTVLGVTTIDALLDAVRRVHASAHAPAALAYRARMGVVGAPRVAVVIQRMVDAECAGVLFTRDPVSGADVRVIECAWGLGEAVVSGLVVPERHRVDRAGRVLSRDAGCKDVRLRVRPRHAGGGTEELPVDEIHARAFCLDATRLARLEALAARCEAVFHGIHDLEFAFTAHPGDTLHLLQRRTITRAGARGPA